MRCLALLMISFPFLTFSQINIELAHTFPGWSSNRYLMLSQGPFIYMGHASGRQLYKFNTFTKDWEELASNNVNWSSSAYGILENKIYIFGGKGGFGVTTNDCYSYNIDTDTWSYISSFPGDSRQAGACFTIGDRIFYGLGVTAYGDHYNDLWEYIPAFNSWQQKASYPGTGLHQPAEVVHQDKYYRIGGNQLSPDVNSRLVYEYDPQLDKWTQKTSFPVRTEAGHAFSIGEYIYSGFGWGESPDYEAQNKIYAYNPVTNVWNLAHEYEAPEGIDGFYMGSCTMVGETGYFTGLFDLEENLLKEIYTVDVSCLTHDSVFICPDENTVIYDGNEFEVGEYSYLLKFFCDTLNLFIDHANFDSISITQTGNQLSVPDYYEDYQWWYNNSVQITGGNQSSLLFSSPGLYTLHFYDPSTGCTLEKEYSVTTNLTGVESDGFKVIANGSRLQVDFDNSNSINYYEIFDLLGTKIAESYQTETFHLNQGVYLIKGHTNGNLEVKKVFVE